MNITENYRERLKTQREFNLTQPEKYLIQVTDILKKKLLNFQIRLKLPSNARIHKQKFTEQTNGRFL